MSEVGTAAPGRWVRGDVEVVGRCMLLRPAPLAELAVANRAAFADGLTQLGLDPGPRESLLELRDEVAGEVAMLDDHYAAIGRSAYRASTPAEVVRIAARRQRAIERLSTWFAKRWFAVRAARIVAVRVPLFAISAPPIRGCRVSIRPKGREAGVFSARVTIHGVAASGATSQFTTTAPLIADAGEAKVLFLPVEVVAAEVSLYEHGRPIGHGLQLAVAAGGLGPVVMRLASGTTPPFGALRHTYRRSSRAGTFTVARHIAEHAPDDLREMRLPLGAFGVEASVAVSVSMTRPIVADLQLVEGHHYELHDVAHCHGIAVPAC